MNSRKNIDQFVSAEVNTCVTSMVDYVLGKSWEDANAPFTWDDVSNAYEYVCPECGETILSSDDDHAACEYCDWTGGSDELATELQDIFEWWSVSGWLCERLKEEGCPVIEDQNLWGRTCTGQSITLDGVIEKIFNDVTNSVKIA